jgi:hypothetical protein
MLRPTVLVFCLLLGQILGPSPAKGATDWAIVVAAHDGNLQVAGLDDGTLVWRKSGETAWESGNLKENKNGVSNLYWNGTHFVATTFFGLAKSTNGKDWSQSVVPAGQAFDPGNIISDSDFFKRGSMTVEAVQKFLNSKVGQCRSGFVCLKDYSERTFDRAPSAMCGPYRSSGLESAAQIVSKVSEACGVATEVLLVLLQKEQSLVTHQSPSASRFQKATGYACPDTAPCDTQYFGFYNQVYHAAKQFKRYANPPGTSRFFTWYPVGQTSNVLNHPNSQCGRTPVTIRNQATAGLYYYTPYAPNSSSVRAFTGIGDSCSSYGNRNFWRIYNLWFNQTKNYSTWYLHSGSAHLVIDHEGSVARGNSALTSWTVATRVPGTQTQKILNAGYLTNGSMAVLRADGRVYSTPDGISWVRVDDSSVMTASSWTLKVSNGAIEAWPDAPKNIRVNLSEDVTVTWDASLSPDVLHYSVYLLDRKNRVLGSTQPLAPIEGAQQSLALSTTELGGLLKAHTDYTIAVSASNELDESEPAHTKQSRFRVGGPGTPTSLSVSLADGGAITWSPPTNLTGAPIISYRVQLLNSKGRLLASSQDIDPVAGPLQSVKFSDTPFGGLLQSGVVYRISATAVTKFGESDRPSKKNSVLFLWQPPTEIPPSEPPND